MPFCFRRAFASGPHQLGEATGASSVRGSTWPSQKAALATRLACRKWVVGSAGPSRSSTGDEIEYDSSRSGGLFQAPTRAESENISVVEVPAVKSVSFLVSVIGYR